jgi:Ca-activated chloride channel homolog
MKNTVLGVGVALSVVLLLIFAAAFACGTGSDRGYVPAAVSRPSRTGPSRTAGHTQSAPAEMTYMMAAEADESAVALAAPAAAPAGVAAGPMPDAAFNREQYHAIDEADFRSAREQPLSTFSVDVDTASYSNVRRFLTQGQRPPIDAVRVEELINYFSYERPQAASDGPIALDAEVARSPFDPRRALVRIGVRASAASSADPPAKRFVFLIDVSGSMSDENKLPLLKRTLGLLVPQLTSSDRVGIVVYAGASGVVLEPTRGHNHEEIMNAIESLQPGGSTNGAAGIELAYQLAHQSCRRGDNCRVLLATDGDFNVGLTDEGSLTRLIERERDAGIFLTVLGFGMGNLQDGTMELLADKGDGSYAYIDTLAEARKVLVEQASATLRTVAKDTKIQVELNPARVARYRLIGYENRRLNDEDFNDDRKDAGDMGDGHTVTALYELELRETGEQRSGVATRVP